MKNLLWALTLMGILLSGHIFSQTNNFKLSDYKLPLLKRKTLDINFNLEGKNSYTNNTQGSRDPSKTRLSDFTNNTRFNYTSYLNSLTKQQETYANFYFSSSFHSLNIDEGNKYKNHSFSTNLYLNSDNRYYFKTDKFYEIDYRLSYSFRSSGNKRWEQEILNHNNNNRHHTLNLSLPLKIGKGRIEQVQDARHAVYILDELAKENKISDDLSNQDILEFAIFISELKNKRFFDSRLRRIAELEALDSFLKSKNYVTEVDSRYFTTLLDFWEYGNSFIRKSGNRISFAVTPGYSYITSKSTRITSTEFDRKTNILSISGGLEYLRNKPINLNWQNDIRISASIYFNKEKIDENASVLKERVNEIRLGFAQNYAYYHNTRTVVRFSYAVHYTKRIDKRIMEESKTDDNWLYAYTMLDLDYYISSRFRLNFNSRLSYNRHELNHWYNNNLGNSVNTSTYEISGSSKSRMIELEYSIGLLYSIF